MPQRFTQAEAGRILGVETRRLRYWERLGLVRARARWGDRFYSFGDLVALRTVKRLTDNRIPARRLRRAVRLVEGQFGSAPLQEWRFFEHGRDVLVIPPGAARPFSPLTRQWFLPFGSRAPLANLHQLAGPRAEELFQLALDCEERPGHLPHSADTYRRVLDLEPAWIDAHVNLGVVLYQMGRLDDAYSEFRAAVELDPAHGISRYNLGCVLEELGQLDEAIEHFRRAARAMPAHADVFFNLALAYEKRGELPRARKQWRRYLRCAPNGPWAAQARAHLKKCSLRGKRALPIPFPSRN